MEKGLKVLPVVFLMMHLIKAQKLSDQFIKLRFESRSFHYLNITRLEATFVDDKLDCSFACLQNNFCVSFNVAVFADDKAKLWCELLPSTRHNNSVWLTSHNESHHYSVQVSNVWVYNRNANTKIMQPFYPIDKARLDTTREI